MDQAVSYKKKKRIKTTSDVILFKAIGYPLLFLFAVLCVVPFLLIVMSSFTDEEMIIRYGYNLWPRKFSVESYKMVFENPTSILRAYGVTALVTVVGTSLGVFINTMTGYVLQRKDFRWRNKFSFFFFFTTLFNGGLVPWYILCIKYLNFKDSLLGLFVPILVSVWNILLVKGFMAGIPFEITESAKIDGAGDFTVFVRLIIPLSKPVIATIGLFTALGFWNDWYYCMLFINNDKLYNLQYLLYKLINDAKMLRQIMEEAGIVVDAAPIEGMKMALTVVVIGPIILLYPFVQRYFVKGLTLGSVKG